MQANHVPPIDRKYWSALMLASIFGANTGDFFADVLDLGHLAGLPALAALFVVTMVVERLDKRRLYAYFWIAIVIIRTSATNLGDLAHDWRLDARWVIVALTLVLAAIVAAWKRRYEARAAAATEGAGGLATTPVYWLCMLIAGTLGTVVGDYFSFGLQLHPLNAAGILGAFLVIAFVIFRRGLRGARPNLGYYWLVVVLIRSAGTAAGDYLAHQWQLPVSTVATGLAFIALLALWRPPVRQVAPVLNG